MADEEEPQETELSDNQKIDIAKWFLLNSPPGEIQYMAKDLRLVLKDENVYRRAASEAFPLYNKTHIISLQFPNRSGDVLVSSFSEISEDEYLDPRTAQVGKVDHVKQICTEIRPARDEELPSPYIEDYRCALDAEVSKYVSETYPKGVCSVYCTSGKDVEEPGFDFELVVLITATRLSPQNFCNGSWRSIWNIEFMDDLQTVEVRGKMQVGAHYFEEGNVQLDAQHECKDSTMFQISVAITLRTGFFMSGNGGEEMDFDNSQQQEREEMMKVAWAYSRQMILLFHWQTLFDTMRQSICVLLRHRIPICQIQHSRISVGSFQLLVHYSRGTTLCNLASQEISQRSLESKSRIFLWSKG